MSATVIDGKAIAARVEEEVRAEVERLRAAGVAPRLDLVAFGDDPAFASYAKGRRDACARVGISSEEHVVAEGGVAGSGPGRGRAGGADRTRDAARALRSLSDAPDVDGILIQMPLPAGLDERVILAALDPAKDVDGVHPENLGRLYLGAPRFVPCTAAAVARILEEERVETAGRHAVVVGRSVVVGRAVALLLLEKGARGDATVTVCHSRTPDLVAHMRRAEILVAAIGRPGAIRGEMLRAGVVAIDVGTSSVPDAGARRGYRIAGDLDFPSVAEVASRVTPVPGGVGPVTVAMLLSNTVRAACRRAPTDSARAPSSTSRGGPA